MKALIPVLESLGIHNVVSLDDDYDTSKLISQYASVSIDDLMRSNTFSQEDNNLVFDIGVTTVGDLLKNKNVPDPLKEKAQAFICDLEQSKSALSLLEQAFQDTGVNYHMIYNVSQIESTETDGAIWFIDKDITGTNILPEAIPCLARKTGDIPHIVVVFTSDDSLRELNESWQRRCDYLVNTVKLEQETARMFAYSFFVISKKEVSEKRGHNEAAACQYIEKTLVEALIGYCSIHVVSAMQAHAATAYENLLNIAKDATESTLSTIHYNMVAEGEPNVYHAFKTIHGLMQEKEYTAGFDKFEKYIRAMKRAVLLFPPAENNRQKTIESIILQHDWAQYQFIHKDVNLSFSDVAYGDIFKLTYDGKPYIGVLITQPCDCIIRENGGETKRKAQSFTLLLYQEKVLRKDELHDKFKKLQNSGVFLDYHVASGDDTAWEVHYLDAEDSSAFSVQLSPFILDLTSINENGTAKLVSGPSLSEIISKKKPPNWAKYEHLFKHELQIIEERIKTLQDNIPDNAEEFLTATYKIPFLPEQQMFDIERVGHLELNLTELITYHYVTHAYRTGKNSLVALHGTDNGQGDV